MRVLGAWIRVGGVSSAGFTLFLERFGSRAAIAATALLFGLAHGFLIALPIFVAMGLVLAWLRSRTRSVYPGMLVHGPFNGAITVLAVVPG